MVRIPIFLFVLMVAGCAMTPERASGMSEQELCIKWMSPFIRGTDKMLIQRELLSRNVPIYQNCPIHWENNTQMMNTGIQMMQRYR
jgi:hypothetical protein